MDRYDDLLRGRKAIIAYLGLNDRQGDHLITKGHIPTFRIGGMRCATKSGLKSYFERKMAETGGIGPPGAISGNPQSGAEIVELRPPSRELDTPGLGHDAATGGVRSSGSPVRKAEGRSTGRR